jgi:hypothetical protein
MSLGEAAAHLETGKDALQAAPLIRSWQGLMNASQQHGIIDEQLGDMTLRLHSLAEESPTYIVDAYTIKEKADDTHRQLLEVVNSGNESEASPKVMQALGAVSIMSENANSLGIAMDTMDEALGNARRHLRRFIQDMKHYRTALDAAKEFYDNGRKGQQQALNIINSYLRHNQSS